jgi:hypothetical protein
MPNDQCVTVITTEILCKEKKNNNSCLYSCIHVFCFQKRQPAKNIKITIKENVAGNEIRKFCFKELSIQKSSKIKKMVKVLKLIKHNVEMYMYLLLKAALENKKKEKNIHTMNLQKNPTE